MPVDRLLADIGEMRKAVEMAEKDRRDIWSAISASRDAASDFKSTANVILSKLDNFEKRATDRHDRLDRQNEKRDEAISALGLRVSAIETEKRLAAAVVKTGWGGLGALGLWLAQHFFGVPK